MKAQISGFRDGERWPPAGSTVDVPADEAAALIANGYATKGADKVETKTESAPETATAARKRPAKKASK